MVIPKNVQRMEDDVFYDCTDLEKVSILGPVACIRQQVFDYCLSLKTVEFGHGIGEIQTSICLNTPDEILVPQGAGQYYKDRLFPKLQPSKEVMIFLSRKKCEHHNNYRFVPRLSTKIISLVGGHFFKIFAASQFRLAIYDKCEFTRLYSIGI